jgi:type II secretory pathway predicted ATPase ExeA
MTLEEYFELTTPPFPKAANSKTLLMNPALNKVITRLRFAIERDAIAMVIAESGCGKSTALALFAQSLDAANYNVVSTSLTTLNPFSFIAHLTTLIGLPPQRYKGEAAALFIKHLRSLPKRTILLVDEAHLLPDSSLEDLRLLTADDMDRKSPFALVLVGQPRLRDRISEPQHYALWQRIGVRLQLRPLTQDEVTELLARHIKAAGCRKKNVFEPQAITEIFRHSRGVPRLLENMALQAMLVAMETQKSSVDAEAVQTAIVDMDLH